MILAVLSPTTLVSGASKIEERAIALEVAGDEFAGFVAEDALHWAFRSGLDGSVDAVDGDRLLGGEGEVDDGDVRGRDADGEAVQLAGQLGDDQLEGLGGAGRAGDQVDGGSAGAAKVLVREVEDDLVVGVAVDGGHDSGDDAEGVLQDLGDGREAVGGAARVGDDVVFGRVVLAFVDAEHQGDVFVGGGGGDDDFLHGRAEMDLGLFGVGEDAGGFDDDLRAYRGPVELGGVAFRVDFESSFRRRRWNDRRR